MRAFEVHLNGKRLCTAGTGEDGSISAIITNVAGKRGNDLELRVGGLIAASDEFVDWTHRRLKTGDEIRVKIVDAPSANHPRKRYRRDPNTRPPLSPI